MTAHGTAQREAIGDLIARFTATVSVLDPAQLSGAEFISVLSEAEGFGRLVDSLRVRLAAEAKHRIEGPVDALGAAAMAG
jgi:hypothetical protein